MIITRAKRKNVLVALCDEPGEELTVFVDSTGRMCVVLPPAANAALRRYENWIAANIEGVADDVLTLLRVPHP